VKVTPSFAHASASNVGDGVAPYAPTASARSVSTVKRMMSGSRVGSGDFEQQGRLLAATSITPASARETNTDGA